MFLFYQQISGVPCARHGKMRQKQDDARRSVSRVLSSSEEPGRSFVWDTPRGMPHATNPSSGAGEPLKSSQISAAPIRSCSRWGLPCLPCCQRSGALLPHRFTLTFSSVPWFPMRHRPEGGLFSVALSLRSPSPAVSRHRSPVEPGLSSLLHKSAEQRPSDRLAAPPCVGQHGRSRGKPGGIVSARPEMQYGARHERERRA